MAMPRRPLARMTGTKAPVARRPLTQDELRARRKKEYITTEPRQTVQVTMGQRQENDSTAVNDEAVEAEFDWWFLFDLFLRLLLHGGMIGYAIYHRPMDLSVFLCLYVGLVWMVPWFTLGLGTVPTTLGVIVGGFGSCLTLLYFFHVPSHIAFLWGGVVALAIYVSLEKDSWLNMYWTDKVYTVLLLGMAVITFKHVPSAINLFCTVGIFYILVFSALGFHYRMRQVESDTAAAPPVPLAFPPAPSPDAASEQGFPAVREHGGVSGAEVPDVPEFDPFYDMLLQLDDTFLALPEDVRPMVASIGESTVGLLQCMGEDPGLREQGLLFLQEFLPAVVDLADKHARLLTTRAAGDEVEEGLAQSAATLSRLQRVFAQELRQFLQNDIHALTSHLDDLDAMLKMKGC